MSAALLIGAGVTTWLYAAHGLALRSDFSVLELERLGEPCPAISGQIPNLRLQKVKREMLPVVADREWYVRNWMGLWVAAGSYGTVLKSYCGTSAWAPIATAETVPIEIRVVRGKSISTSRFNHTILHSFLPNILALHGNIMLHATSVVIDGNAYVFAGRQRHGQIDSCGGLRRAGIGNLFRGCGASCTTAMRWL